VFSVSDDDNSSKLAAGLVPVFLLALVALCFGYFIYRRKQK
jgi:hypothetical protein